MLTKAQAYPLPFIGQYLGFRARFKLHELFKYVDEDPSENVTVPIEALTDGGSIPPFVYGIIGGPWSGKYVEAVIIHDWECHIAKTQEDRRKADMKFLKGMEILGVAWWRRRVMWRAVRVQGVITMSMRIRRMKKMEQAQQA